MTLGSVSRSDIPDVSRATVCVICDLDAVVDEVT